jgi:alkanesulfonate monooxygenase SsuD/methylene tetrahydromethanopterin reductase-like flavin-dependent oxidoreductase (luciferase family)
MTAAPSGDHRAGDIPGMAAAVPDDLLDQFVVSGDVDTVIDGLRERYDATATRVVLYFAAAAWADDPSTLNRYGEVARALRSGG